MLWKHSIMGVKCCIRPCSEEFIPLGFLPILEPPKSNPKKISNGFNSRWSCNKIENNPRCAALKKVQIFLYLIQERFCQIFHQNTMQIRIVAAVYLYSRDVAHVACDVMMPPFLPTTLLKKSHISHESAEPYVNQECVLVEKSLKKQTYH